jgi:hypothetical protein
MLDSYQGFLLQLMASYLHEVDAYETHHLFLQEELAALVTPNDIEQGQ